MKRLVTLTALVAAFALVAHLVDADRPVAAVEQATLKSTVSSPAASSIKTASAQTTVPIAKDRIAKVVEDNPDLVSTLLSGITASDDDSQTGSAYLVLMSLGRPTLLKLIEIAEGENASLRSHAMPIMIYGAVQADFPLEEAVPAMIRLAKSEDEEVALAAHYALRMMLLISSDESYRSKVKTLIHEVWLDE